MTTPATAAAASAARRARDAATRRRARAALLAAGLTVEQIAVAMGTSTAAVRRALRRDRAEAQAPQAAITWE